MPYFDPEIQSTEQQLRRAISSIYLLARTKRCVVYRYETGKDGKERKIRIGPKSRDKDWDKVADICGRVGVRLSTVRTAAIKGE